MPVFFGHIDRSRRAFNKYIFAEIETKYNCHSSVIFPSQGGGMAFSKQLDYFRTYAKPQDQPRISRIRANYSKKLAKICEISG